MGNETSVARGLFTEEEIRKLGAKFATIDTDKSGGLSLSEISSLPSLGSNPIMGRMISIMDKDQSGEVDFREFIDSLSYFSHRGELKAKVSFLFKIYDINGDGYITNSDLFKAMKTLVNNSITDEQLQCLVDRTILKYDVDGDGRLSLEEFTKATECYHQELDKIVIDLED